MTCIQNCLPQKCLLVDQYSWSDVYTKALETVRMEMESEFNIAKVHKMLWTKISHILSGNGCTATSTQCSNKWKSLKNEYRKTVDNNNKSGAGRKTCRYYEDFNQLYGNRSATKPQFVLASMPVPGRSKSDV